MSSSLSGGGYSRGRFCWWVVLLLIFLLAGAFRFVNLGKYPAWYGDECVELLLARDFASGRMAWDAWEYRTMMPPYSFSPPFYVQGAALFLKLTGAPPDDQLLYYRGYTSIMATAAVPAIAWLGRLAAGPWTGLAAALVYAVHPVAIAHGRYGFRHNQSMLFNLLFLIFALLAAGYARHGEQDAREHDAHSAGGAGDAAGSSRKWILLAALACGLSFFATYRSYVTVLAMLLLIISHFRATKDVKGCLGALLIMGGPGFIMYLPFIARDGTAFFGNMASDLWNNVASPASHLFPARSFSQRILEVNGGFLDLVSYDLITLMGFIGLLLIRNARAARVLFLFLLVALLTIVDRQTSLRSFFYPAIIIAPLFSLGTAVVLLRLGRAAAQIIKPWGVRPAVFRLSPLLLAAIIAIVPAIAQITGKMRMPLSHLSTVDTDNARKAAVWINERVTDEDVVIAAPTLSWLLRGKRANLLQSFAYVSEKCPPFFFQPMPRARFFFKPDLASARILVISEIDEAFTLRMPGVRDYMNRSLANGDFELARIMGEYRIYVKNRK
ncbi:MAG: hypothetical protein CVV64_17330 [Candidatus Wallbacteria bacterium HGW-Wallbacteria-1]|jgi:4-amino-4-deoxy-L-arabinose transferase-like glycosyltransferase|uniref:Glycosyltransferase RgtA/B/C/D-like domain-containing protein n=1 Tax=Candidatus Wallbacteria bacterium HGW-Wallbacteria-1 TaxID=2013854 RepID=A0A2N1PK85_9BACT|nr:MAG: hypothetical protein CVV64_17330 [Candidatus Wallbacteria bacterium HGW-Wallbacteria-1]